MGLDISIYNKDGTSTDVSEISENLHYWLFNLAHLDKGRFRTIFRVQDYYLKLLTKQDNAYSVPRLAISHNLQ